MVTSTAADNSSTFTEATRQVSARYPTARVSLGPSTEALVAQAPVAGAAPTVELLRNLPSAAGDLLDIVIGSVEPFDELHDESMSPVALRAMAARWIERQQGEREALLSALRAYQDLADAALDRGFRCPQPARGADRVGPPRAPASRHRVPGPSRCALGQDLDLGGAVRRASSRRRSARRGAEQRVWPMRAWRRPRRASSRICADRARGE